MREIFEIVGGRPMRGFASDGADLEPVTVLHDMGKGSFAAETVWRAVTPPAPAPEPEAPPQSQEAPQQPQPEVPTDAGE